MQRRLRCVDADIALIGIRGHVGTCNNLALAISNEEGTSLKFPPSYSISTM